MRGVFVSHRNKKYDWVYVVIVLGLVVVSEFSGWFGILQSYTQKFTNPTLSQVTSRTQSLLGPLLRLSRYPALAGRLSNLEYDYAQSLSRVSELERELYEMEAIRSAINESANNKAEPFLTTTLISYSQPALAAGSDQGVRKSMLVLVAGTAVGVVDQVDKTQSTVSLFSENGRHPIIIVTESGVQGVIEGDGRRVYLSLVPQGAVLSNGESVVTLGQENIGSGIFIGKITSVEDNSAAATKRAQLDQLVSFFSAPVVELR